MDIDKHNRKIDRLESFVEQFRAIGFEMNSAPDGYVGRRPNLVRPGQVQRVHIDVDELAMYDEYHSDDHTGEVAANLLSAGWADVIPLMNDYRSAQTGTGKKRTGRKPKRNPTMPRLRGQ